MNVVAPLRRSNPFSTRWTRPGAIPFLLPENETWESLLERLATNAWRGQIIGPHGSGKSTLLDSLRERLAMILVETQFVVIRDGGRQEPDLWHTLRQHRSAPSRTSRLGNEPLRLPVKRLLVVDGAEQLTWLARRRLLLSCQRRQWGLVITAHRDWGLPTLLQIEPNAEMAQLIVDQLLVDQPSCVTSSDIFAAFTQHAGDYREMLFSLYDLHEERSRRL